MNIDEMIKSYSDELMSYAKEHNSKSLVTETAVESTDEKPHEEEASDEASQEESECSTDVEDAGEEVPPNEISSEDELENYATFKGRVFTGFSAYPVEKAKVILYRDDVLYAFLVTDKNGETPRIKIESFPEKNSLEPLSDEQRTDYSADVYADGFVEKKNLLVSAVGGSDVVLDVDLTPESEVIN